MIWWCCRGRAPTHILSYLFETCEKKIIYINHRELDSTHVHLRFDQLRLDQVTDEDTNHTCKTLFLNVLVLLRIHMYNPDSSFQSRIQKVDNNSIKYYELN